MKKYLIFGILLVLFLPVILLMANLNALVNAGKGRIVAAGEKSLGRTMSVGRVKLSFHRGIGLRLEDVIVAGDPASAGNLVEVPELDLEVKFVPLLAKRLEIKSASSAEGTIRGTRYTNLKAGLTVDAGEVVINDLSAGVFDGLLRAHVRIRTEGDVRDIVADLKLVGCDLSAAGELLGGWKAVPAEGRVDVDVGGLEARGENLDQLIASLGARGSFGVGEGKILGVNIARMIFDRVSSYPGMSAALSSELESRYPAVFRSRDTRFKSWKSDFRLEKGRMRVQNLVLDAGDYVLEGKGWIGLDASLDLDVVFTAGKSFSRDVVARVKAAKYLQDKEGRINLPLHMGGTMRKPVMKPDERYLQEVLERALFGGALDMFQRRDRSQYRR
jgi:hypothetical protein